jgi:hypothetical protein
MNNQHENLLEKIQKEASTESAEVIKDLKNLSESMAKINRTFWLK